MTKPSATGSPFEKYSIYTAELNALLDNICAGNEESLSERHMLALDGQAGRRLRDSATLRNRKSSGAFFTTSEIRKVLIDNDATEQTDIGQGKAAYDPCCGAGDLLIEWSKKLPVVNTSLECTLQEWGRDLHGTDIHREFIETAKVRLVLAALSRGCEVDSKDINPSDYFPNIRVGDCLAELEVYKGINTILLNPPFVMMDTPERHSRLSSGKVSMAAVVLMDAIVNSDQDTLILGVLPDVLRSGSRYQRWRKDVNAMCDQSRWDVYGQFSPHVDIDVFLIRLRKRMPDAGVAIPTEIEPAPDTVPAVHKIQDRCFVRVGPVIPHRHVENGNPKPYIDAVLLPSCGTFLSDQAPRRSYNCTVYKPPFVAVRRTSRPGTSRKSMSLVVVGTEPVLVENHVMILKPYDESVNSCYEVSDLLNSEQARQWLDERIRCRHLTTASLKDMPLFFLNNCDDHPVEELMLEHPVQHSTFLFLQYSWILKTFMQTLSRLRTLFQVGANN